jgi:negative regulator of sigma E activity
MRGEIVCAGTDLSPRISVALDNEPTVLAPRALNKDSRVTGDIWKPISMFAIAASLALVAVITLNPADKKVSGQNQLASTTAPAETIQQQKFAQEFAVMLVEHGEFTATAGLNGLVAYAKLVSNQRLDQ